MRIEEKANPGWEPVTDVTSTEKFICTYGGPFAQRLLVNRPVLEKFLEIASLDGRVLLEESKRIPRYGAPDINPDGSVIGKGVLRWEEKPVVEDGKDSILFQVRPDEAGWVVAINGGLLTERLMKKDGSDARKIEAQFAQDFNWYLQVGLKEALLKDKLTFIKDPFLLGRILATGVGLSLNFLYPIFFHDDPYLAPGIWQLLFNYVGNITTRNWQVYYYEQAKRFGDFNFMNIFNFSRKTVNSPYEALLGFPLELDRLILAHGYLDLQKLKGSLLVKIASD